MSTSSRELALLVFLRDNAPRILDRYFVEDSRCIASTRIAIEVLRALGVAAEPMPVIVAAANAAYLETALLVARGKLRARQAVRRGAKMVILDTQDCNPLRWPGHLVAFAPQHRVLLDLDSGQFARPDDKIEVPRSLILQVPQDWARTRPVRHALALGGRIEYGRLDQYPPYANAPDWYQEQFSGPAVASILRAAQLAGFAPATTKDALE